MLCFLSRLVSSPVQKWKRSTSEAGEPISRLPWLARIRRTPLVCAGTSTVTPLTKWRGRVSTPGDFPTSMSFGALLFEGLSTTDWMGFLIFRNYVFVFFIQLIFRNFILEQLHNVRNSIFGLIFVQN